MPSVVSLFSGCGGSDLGLHQAGFETVMANDILTYARDFYEQNINIGEFVLKDVSTIKNFPNAELLVGCYPCQGFSQGGVRSADKKINYLYREFARALNQIKPKAFIVENVSGMTRSTYKHLFKSQLATFRRAGYKVDYKVLNAAEYGLPQERNRLFFVGIRSDLGVRYKFPTPSHGEGRAHSFVTQREALANMPLWPTGEYCDDDFHWYYLSRDRYRGWDELSKTVVSNQRHVPLHPVSPKLLKLGPDKWIFESEEPARRISYREAAVLQGFPREFLFPESRGMASRYTVIGNAVPPPIMRAIANELPDIWD